MKSLHVKLLTQKTHNRLSCYGDIAQMVRQRISSLPGRGANCVAWRCIESCRFRYYPLSLALLDSRRTFCLVVPEDRGPSTTENRWLCTEKVAACLGVKRDTIYKWRIRHQMPAHKVGKLWKFRKEEVDRWVVSGKAGGRSVNG